MHKVVSLLNVQREEGGGNIAPDANELIYFVYECVLLLLRPRLL